MAPLLPTAGKWMSSLCLIKYLLIAGSAHWAAECVTLAIVYSEEESLFRDAGSSRQRQGFLRSYACLMPRPCKDTENKTNINSRYGLRLVTQSRVIHYRSMFFSGPCVTPAGNKDQGKTQDKSLAESMSRGHGTFEGRVPCQRSCS